MRRVALALLAVLTSGFLFAISLPPVSYAAAGWFSLVPLLLAVQKQGFLKGFLAGIFTGLTAAAVSLTPVFGPNLVQDGLANWNIVGFGLYAVVIALMAGAFAEIGVKSNENPKLTHAIPLAALAVLVELLTFIKLPAHLALTQFANPAALALASVTGIWGVSFILWLAQFSLATTLPDLFKKQKQRIPATIAGTIALAAFASQTILHRLPPTSTTLPQNQSGVLAALQTSESGGPALLELQSPLAPFKPRLAVWPELSISSFDIPTISKFSKSPNGWPIVATYHDDHRPKPHNAAVLIDQNGLQQPYFKRQPFGEESNEITAGTKAVTVLTKSQNVGLNICFDSCFPWVMRQTALQNHPDLIALPTLDPPSPNGFIQAAHAAFTPFRAAELGVPIVRAESTAWSMLVDSNGKITRLAPVGWQGPLADALRSGTHPTLYKMFGDWFLALCLILCLASFATNLKRKD